MYCNFDCNFDCKYIIGKCSVILIVYKYIIYKWMNCNFDFNYILSECTVILNVNILFLNVL